MNTINAVLIDMTPLPGLQFARDIEKIITAGSRFPVHVDEFNSSQAGLLGGIRQRESDIVFVILPDDFGDTERTLIRTLSQEPGRIPVIAVIADGKPEAMIELLKLGVVDFLTPPIKAVDVLPRLWRTVEHARKRHTLVERLKETVGLKQLVGKSQAFLQVIEKIPAIAQSDVGVQITGETGTGKEMCARAIHYLGPRSDKPFTPVNCGAIPVELIENELFGHAKGAFTSAVAPANGLIHETDGGTLFLDEIDSLTLAAQVKLLRFLQEKEYRQLGSARTLRADVRIIAATNIELEQAVSNGGFRRDLYYRLNIIQLALPPLRKRMEDISLLVSHFMNKHAAEFNKPVDGLTDEAMEKLHQYDWPGNVRELENIIVRAVVLAQGTVLDGPDIALPQAASALHKESFREQKARVVAEFEKRYMRGLLITHHGNISKAAQSARKNRRAFWELIKKYQIDVQQFKAPTL